MRLIIGPINTSAQLRHVILTIHRVMRLVEVTTWRRRDYRVLKFLKQQGLTVEVLVTDRHKQINKWLREDHSNITHYYDVWHVAKGM